MKIIDLLHETSEITLEMNGLQMTNALMGLDAHLVIGGQKLPKEVDVYENTPIETRYSNGDIGADMARELVVSEESQ